MPLSRGMSSKSEQVAEGEGLFALPVCVHVIFLDFHRRAVPEHAFDHCRNF